METVRTDEARRQTEALGLDLSRRDALADIVRILLSESVDGVLSVAQIVGETLDADRCYVIRLRDSYTTVDNVAEWCAPGTRPDIRDFQGEPCESYPWLMARLWQGHEICFPDVSDMPPGATYERAAFRKWGIRAVLVVPMFMGKRLAGFIGVDDVGGPHEWLPEDAQLLRTMVRLLVANEVRSDLERECRDLAARLEKALARALGGDLPICGSCKRIKDEEGNWTPLELFVQKHTEANLQEGLCPYCRQGIFPRNR